MKATFTIFASLLVSANAAITNPGFTFSNQYPPISKVPDVTSTQVKQWISQINMTAVPSFPLVPAVNGSPGALKKDPGSCDWSYNNCYGPTDIWTCPTGYWGLTYDDGPTQFSTALYDELIKTNTKSTLFWIGSNLYTNPLIGKRACSDGHQIAVHTWSHQPSTSLTNEQFIAEVKWTETIIKEVCGVTPKYFRPPFGDIDNRIRGLLTQMGYVAVIWDIDTNDWQMPPGGQRTAAQIDTQFAGWIADNQKNKTGHICLEHELYLTTVTEAIKQLPNIMANWKPMPVASCVNDSHPYVEATITFPTIANGMSNATASNASSSLPSSATPTGPAIAGSNATLNTSSANTTTSLSKSSATSLPSAAPIFVSFVFMLASVFLAL